MINLLNNAIVGLAVFIGDRNITDWFVAAKVTGDINETGVIITKKNNTQVEVTFKTGKITLC